MRIELNEAPGSEPCLLENSTAYWPFLFKFYFCIALLALNMIYVLWGLLNLFLLGFFIKTLYQSALILNKELSRFSIVILVLGLVSYACQPYAKPPDEISVWENPEAAEVESSPIGGREILAEKGLTYTRKVDYLYGKDSLGNKIIAKAFWRDNGLRAFTKPKLVYFSVFHGDFSDLDDRNNSLKGPVYQAHLDEEWYLLGIRILTHSRQIKGTLL